MMESNKTLKTENLTLETDNGMIVISREGILEFNDCDYFTIDQLELIIKHAKNHVIYVNSMKPEDIEPKPEENDD